MKISKQYKFFWQPYYGCGTYSYSNVDGIEWQHFVIGWLWWCISWRKPAPGVLVRVAAESKEARR